VANWIKQSTAVVISFGPFVDKTDGVTPETGLVSAIDHASTGIMLSKNGGAFAVRSATVTASTYDAYGNYRVTLSATDTNTLGALRVQFIETATCLPVWADFQVLPAMIYDSIVAGSDRLDTNVTHINDVATSSVTTVAAVLGTTSAPTVTSGRINADITHIAAAAVSTSTAQLGVNVVNFGGSAGTFASGRPEVNTTHAAGTAWGSGAITAASIATGAITSAKFAAGAIDNAAMSIDGSELTAIPWNAAWDEEVQSEVDDALIAKGLDHLVFASVAGTDVADNSIIAKLASKSATADWDSYDNTTDSLEANRDNIGTAGAGLTGSDDAVLAAIAALNNITAASVWAVGTRTLTSLSGLTLDTVTTLTNLPAITTNWLTAAGLASDAVSEIQSGLATAASIAALNNLSAAQVNAEVDTALADINLDHLVKVAVDTDFATTVHLDSVVGQLVDNGTSATFNRTTNSLEALRDRGDAAWTTATGFSTHSAADVWSVSTRLLTAGTNIVLAKGVGVTGFNDLSAAQVNAEADTALADVGLTTTITGRIDAAVSTRASQTSVDTIDDFLDTEIAAILADTNELQTDWTNGGRLDLLIDAIKAKTDNLPAAPAATGDIPTVSQIWTTALTEAYRSTGATGTATQLLYEILQNITEFSISNTTKTVKKLDRSTTAKTYTLNDATTPTAITETT